MKDYKRLTEICNDIIGDCNPCKTQKNALKEIITAIESGELCDREEVRKETAKEILQMLVGHEMRDKGAHMSWVIVKQDVTFIAEKYGIDLFEKTEQVGNSDKLEDEE